eukprot:CAMPEP_0115726024 /NCGR_PEP_ID=MMETSP0272-20121206/81619_1 /TAXON_ID=71861 /ORGANISM="Scrippsiella trochoidea, Strain CCMP3099" /LENGTH=46 /DNA_ID= /DNA_START= /DNA_END= /DNA_ORIENTATION=
MALREIAKAPRKPFSSGRRWQGDAPGDSAQSKQVRANLPLSHNRLS